MSSNCRISSFFLQKNIFLFVQQHIYEGWGRVVGPLELYGLIAAIAVGILVRKQRLPFFLTLSAVICALVAQVIWQLHNGPVNQAVDSWTLSSMPSNWTNYRDRWEYAHAVRAGLYSVSLITLILSLLSDNRTIQKSDSL